MKVIDPTQGIERTSGSDNEVHGEHGQGKDPHIWLSPRLMVQMADSLCNQLSSIDPKHASSYHDNLRALIQEITELNNHIRSVLSNLPHRSFITFHPAWGYFARDYGLRQLPIEVEGKEPTVTELEKVINIARQENVQVVFAEPQFSTRSAEVIAKEIQGKVEIIDDLSADWENNLRHVADMLAENLGSQ
jgi:zinc transport system substrate-binding protein